MKELVEVIAKALVTRPDEVQVTEEVDGKNIVVKLKVADEDIGKIIGKSGGWYKVRYDGKTGFVYGSLVKVVK